MPQMTKQECQLLVLVLRALESLHFRNAALESILEKFPPPAEKLPDWNSTALELAQDPGVQPRTRERFRRIVAEIEDAQIPSQSALAELLRLLPVRGKPN